MEFQVSYNMPGMTNFDNKDFFEFLWLYERLAKQKNQENENSKKENSVSLQDQMRTLTAGR